MATQALPLPPAALPLVTRLDATYQVCRLPDSNKVASGLDALTHRVIGMWHRRRSQTAAWIEDGQQIAERVAALKSVSEREVQERMEMLRLRFRRGRQDENDVHDALALVCTAAGRQVGLEPYPVQITGALALYNGCLAEMATGEGKTLVAVIAGVLAGWTGRPCHIITVNDYLAARDEKWFRQLYRFCHVTTGCVTAEMSAEKRREAYQQDITYVSSKEVLADFLRDRLLLGKIQHAERRTIQELTGQRVAPLVMRGLHTAIVDEADSILIDEAVTPLIISQQDERAALFEASTHALKIADGLQRDEDFTVDERYKEIEFTPAGEERLAAASDGLPELWRNEKRREELVRTALTARIFFKRDQHYLIQDEKIVIVDEFTGRMMPQRTWQRGLHQAIECKEGMEPSVPTVTLASLSYQRFFRCFEKLSGMTGTAAEAATEFWEIYELPVAVIPRNRPDVRIDNPDRVYQTEAEKWEGLAARIVDLHRSGRPILIGTRSIESSEALAERLTEAGIEFQLLNARYHRQEAQMIQRAGHLNQVTIATNMAGRGTDILVDGDVVKLGGLCVLASERHASDRIDRQLYGRCGRQGDPGSTETFISLEDELFRRHSPKWLQLAVTHYGRHSMGQHMALWAMRHAQRSANKLARQQRRAVLRMDSWLDEAVSFGASQL